jgi:CRISPR-associated protein Cas2
MRYLLIYDITHDGTRVKVADACLDYGLERVQYSAFLGDLKRTHQHELWAKIRQRIGKHAAVVHFIPLDDKSWAARHILDQREEEELHV